MKCGQTVSIQKKGEYFGKSGRVIEIVEKKTGILRKKKLVYKVQISSHNRAGGLDKVIEQFEAEELRKI